jgi:hypothetical protein
MIRKTILILALVALLAPALASAAEPAGTTAPAPAPATALPDLGAILGPGTCAAAPATFSLPGCPHPCTVSQNCRYYPEEVCVNGCCAF